MNEASLFAAALEKATPAERQAFLDEACSGDTTLRERLDRLLAADQKPRGILEDGPGGWAGTTPTRPPLAAGRVFAGRFQLREKLGEGGMGEVWVADQLEPLQRRVALKVIRPALDSDRLLARFDQERQALAVMDHPNIAKVLDAGMDDEGYPYIAMELIEGDPITKYCDKARLSPRQRLELFVPVCRALQHAHQKGIIHRDLKPSNILVDTCDGKPVPKVIDFGVAKVTGPRLIDQSVRTEFGTLIGTVEYMSPEQAELNNLDIDTRTDVYALGVLLYELLTGSVPFPRETLHAATFVEMLRIIKEVEATKPSARLAGSESLPSVAAARQTEPRKLVALTRGELDWIVIRCLEKDRSRRYETANGIARDIERYLNDEPVEAGPPSARYKLRKFARRHWRELSAAAAFVLVLVSGVVALSVALVEVNRARQEKAAALEAEGKRRQQARAALDAMSSQVIEDWLAQQPVLQPEHRRFLERSLSLYEEFAADTDQHEESRAGVAQAFHYVGEIRERLGLHADAEAAWQRSLDLYAALSADFPDVPEYRHGLARTGMLLGRLYGSRATNRKAEAEATLLRSQDLYRGLVAEFPANSSYRAGLAKCFDCLGIQFRNGGRVKEAEAAYSQAITLSKGLVADFPGASMARHNLAIEYHNLGRLQDFAGQADDALASFEQAVAVLDPLVADFPTMTQYRDSLARSLNALGDELRAAKRFPKAEDVLRRGVTLSNRLVADFPAVPDYRQSLAIVLNNLGILLKDTNRPKEAEEYYDQALAIHKQLAADFPTVPDHQNEAAGAMVNVARMRLMRHDAPGARRLLEEAVPYHQAALKASPKHPSYRRFYRLNRWRLAETFLELKDHAAAAVTAGEFLRAATEPPRDAYTAACLLADCVRLAAEDERLPDDRRRELAATYGDGAVAALRQVVAKCAKEVAHMKTDPKLDPLRPREDFQKLLVESEFKGRP
jgi:serine/threonine protein kinase